MTGEADTGQVEARSKMKLVRNAKGDPQWEITVVEGSLPVELDRIRGLAVANYRALEREFQAGTAT